VTTYIALLRGINVGGKNKVPMAELKEAYHQAGFADVRTYINSGNVIFASDLDEPAAQAACESLIHERFGLEIAVVCLSAAELTDAVAHAPDWWGSAPDTAHNAIVVIPPMTAEEACASTEPTRPEYEQVACHGKLIFWSAPRVTFLRTRWAKVSANKAVYAAITIRTANPTLKLAELVSL
jgi:uncharacterized protein (DUF1697 family)